MSLMSAAPLISILVPTYNAAGYLPQLCRSLEAQTFKDFEVLIFDDGSSDDLAGAFAPFARDKRFELCGWKQNRGLNAAWRELLKRMRGRFWTSPGADDALFPEFLNRRLERLERRTDAALVHGAVHTIDENGKEIANPLPKFNLPPELDARRALRVLLQHNVINQPSALVRSDVTRSVLPHFSYDWQFAPDWYLWLLHAASDKAFLWDEQPLHHYRVHRQSLSFDPSKSAMRRAEARLVPLCALSAAAGFSPMADAEWRQLRKPLYHLWLARAAKLRSEGLLEDFWITAGGRAFYGPGGDGRHFLWDLGRRAPAVALAALKEWRARSRQSFCVTGLAAVDDPLFK
jgi:glycosyltransferase involved in cell wall biosynthesis